MENVIEREEMKQMLIDLRMDFCDSRLNATMELSDEKKKLIKEICINTPYKNFDEIMGILSLEEYKIFDSVIEAFEFKHKELLDLLKQECCSTCFDFNKWLELHDNEFFKISNDKVLYIEEKHFIEIDGTKYYTTQDRVEEYDSLDNNDKMVLCCYLENIYDDIEKALDYISRGDFQIYDDYRDAFEDMYYDVYRDLDSEGLDFYFDYDAWGQDCDDLYDYDGYVIKLIY